MRQSPLVVAGVIVMIAVFVAALLAPWITPYGPEERIWTQPRQPPSPIHWLGTDENGGDVFSRIIWAARIDIMSALIIVGIAIGVGVPLGAIAAYKGGAIDEVTMRVTDVFFAFPSLILAMAVAAALGRNWTNLVIAVAVTWWPAYTRITRGQVLAERERAYVEAARSIGAGTWRILLRHILPNCLAPLLVQATMDMGAVILVAAGLSFIGFGADPGMAEWGRMVADARNYMFTSPWMAIFPGLAILVTALSFNLVGDGARDILDPRLRR
jgi:peptide/nickel transport system permease protein